MGSELTRAGDAKTLSVLQQKDLGELMQPLIREIHLFDSYAAGTTHLKDPSVLDAVRPGDTLTLRREDNRFDDNAILLLAGDGRKLGYVPEKDNVVFARLMDAGKILKAKVRDIQKREGGFRLISIGIYLIDL